VVVSAAPRDAVRDQGSLGRWVWASPGYVKNRRYVTGEADEFDAPAPLSGARESAISWSVLADPVGNEFHVLSSLLSGLSRTRRT
jgi:hypothetical protein